jgi:hypothetical protein
LTGNTWPSSPPIFLHANKFTLKILLTIIVPHTKAELIINISIRFEYQIKIIT